MHNEETVCAIRAVAQARRSHDLVADRLHGQLERRLQFAAPAYFRSASAAADVVGHPESEAACGRLWETKGEEPKGGWCRKTRVVTDGRGGLGHASHHNFFKAIIFQALP